MCVPELGLDVSAGMDFKSKSGKADEDVYVCSGKGLQTSCKTH